MPKVTRAWHPPKMWKSAYKYYTVHCLKAISSESDISDVCH